MNDKAEITRKLRDNRMKLEEIGLHFNTISERRASLRQERAELLQKADKLGLKVGKKSETT